MTQRIVTSRDNPLLQRVRKLLRDPVGYRKLGQAWLEGEHLGLALRSRGGAAAHVLVSESALNMPSLASVLSLAPDVVVIHDRLFADLSDLPSPAGIGFLIDVSSPADIDTTVPSVVLDRIQDAGNVGSILRSAAAFGFRQVLALRGTAGLWSPKVLRAGMGAHFALQVHEGLEAASLARLGVPLIATSSHADVALPAADLPAPCAWVFGHEGQGVAPELLARCAASVRIPQPGGEESLNVAAAAAVCLYESARRRPAARALKKTFRHATHRSH